jgi:hypothetical protein
VTAAVTTSNTSFINNVALRAKKLDEVVSGFLARYWTRSGSAWSAGLDTPRERLAPLSTAEWCDVEFPAVATARERLVPERPNAHVTGADVRDRPGWPPSPPPGLSRPVLPMNPGRFFHISGDGAVPKGHLHAISIADALAVHVPVLR